MTVGHDHSVWKSVSEDPNDDESTLIFLLIKFCIGILALFWETKPHTIVKKEMFVCLYAWMTSTQNMFFYTIGPYEMQLLS